MVASEDLCELHKSAIVLLTANVPHYFVFLGSRGGACVGVCVVLALFLHRVACCCSIKVRLLGLECAP